MKKVSLVLSILVLSFMVISPVQVYAAFTAPIYDGPEKSLVAVGGILDTMYGLENLQRVDDSLDMLWMHNTDTASVTAIAKYAGYNQSFGYINANGVFTSILTVNSAGDIGKNNTFTAIQSGNHFQFGDDPSGAPLFSSNPDVNGDLKDHMVTWEIIGNHNNNSNIVGNYVVGWEDLVGLGDRDYNDLVVEVGGVCPNNPVPEPMSMLLFGPALLGLISLKRKANS
jgi:hypothetical protein